MHRIALVLALAAFAACPDSQSGAAPDGDAPDGAAPDGDAPDGDAPDGAAPDGAEGDAPDDGDGDASDGADGGDDALASDAAEGGDVAPALISVEVIARDYLGQPVEDAKIVANGPDGALVGVFTSDAAGHATIALPAGGMLTTFGSGGGRSGVFTVTQLSDGDVVPVAAGTVFATPSLVQQPDASFDVALAASSAGASSYRALTPCGRGDAGAAAAAVTIEYRADCLAGASALDVAAWALGGGGAAQAFAWVAAAPVAGPAATLSPWTPLAQLARFDLLVTQAPVGAALASASITTRRGGWETGMPIASPSVAPHFDGDGAFALRHHYDPAFADGVTSALAVILVETPEMVRHFEYQRFDSAPPAEVALSLAPERWAGKSDVAWDGVALSWSSPAAAAEAAPDAERVAVSWRPAGANAKPVVWTLVGPPGMASPLALPTLPEDLALFFAPAVDAEALLASATVVSSAASDGYRSYTARYGTRVDAPSLPDAVGSAIVRRKLATP